MTGLGLSEWIKTDEEIDKNKDDQMQDTESELELQRTNTQNKYIEVAKMLGGADKLNKSIELSKVELEKLFKSTVIQDLKDLETKITIAATNAK